jgi:dihydropteroate synthase
MPFEIERNRARIVLCVVGVFQGERDESTLDSNGFATVVGGAHIVRVHDVAEMVEVARVADCLLALQ